MTTLILLTVLLATATSAATTNDTVNDVDDVIAKDYNTLSEDTTKNLQKDSKTEQLKSDEATSVKIQPEVVVKNKTAKTNTSVVLEARLPNDASGKALFKINGLTIGEAFRTEGGVVKYDYNIPIYSSKNYTISFVYGGNDKYQSARADGILTLTKLHTTASIKTDKTSVAQNEKVRFDVKIKNELKNGIVNAFAVKVNGQSIGTNKTDSDGNGYLYYTIPSTYKINNYTVQLVYGDTNTALGKRVNTTLKVNNPTRIRMDKISNTKTSGILKLRSRVVDKLLNNVTSGEVVYKINGITMGSVNVTNAIAEFEYQLPLYAPRNYTITALYGGNKYYKPSTTNSTLMLTKANVKLLSNDTLKVGQNNSIKLTVTDEFNNSIDNFNIRLVINNRDVGSYPIKDSVAIVNYALNDIDSTKEVNATIIFDANKFYEKATLGLKVSNPTIITLSDIADNKTSGRISLNVTVVDALGNTVNTGKVEFKLDDKALYNITIKEGSVKTTYKLPLIEAGKHNITAIYHGNNHYQQSRTVKEFKALLLGTKISSRNANLTVNKQNIFNITVRDEYNKNVQNATLRLLLNNKEVGRYNVSDGKALIDYTLKGIDSSKQINASVVFDANKYYNTSTMNLKVLNPTKINISTADTKTTKLLYINASITDTTNRNVSSGNVTIYLDNKVILNATVKNGLVKTSYRLPLVKGQKHNITAKYTCDEYYQSSNTTTTVNILKLNTKITPVDVSFVVSSYNKTNVKVLDELNNPVQKGIIRLYVDNQDMGNFTVKNGTSTVLFRAASNDSNCVKSYKLEYIANDYYTTSTATGKMNISPLYTVYVSKNGSDANLGDSKNPYKTIKYAASHLRDGGIIYINPGEYTESAININQSTSICGINSSAAVVIKPSQAGYVFNNSASKANLTLVNITIKNAKINTINSSAVISKGPLIVVNCNFENNQATAADSTSSIYASNDLTISKTNFNNNSAKSNGAAVKALGHRVSIVGSKFTNNSINANNVGGAALYLNSANTTIDSSIFTNNQASGTNVTGAAIKKVSGNLTLMRTNLAYNRLTGSGYNIGAAVVNLNGNLYVINSSITSNNVSSSANCGAAAIYSQNSVMGLYNSTVTSNNAVGKNVYGGAIQNFNTYMIVSMTNFTYNTAQATNAQVVGATINQNNGTLLIENARFHKNTAKATDAYAGAVYFVGTKININYTQFNQNIANGSSVAAGGAVFVNANASISGCNFTSNQALAKSNGGGAIVNAANLTANKNNFISNVASAAGSAISNTGKNVNIENNYWASNSPVWSKLLHGLTKPSKYSSKPL